MNGAGLEGRRALVTGASSGLGEHVAGLLARAGAHVAYAARRLDVLEEIAARDGCGRGIAVAIDVTDPGSVERGIAQTAARLGGIDILINNSGIAVTKPALEQSEDDWNAVIGTNLTGAWRVAQAAARVMRENGGTIVNVGSVVGERTARALAPYAASKAALHHLTRCLAVELARYRIRVNAIAPGYIATAINRDFFTTPAGEAIVRMVPQRRLGALEDLDGPVLLLASDASRYMTGSIVTIDGGLGSVGV